MENKQTKCTCERPDDYVCDYCDEQESKRILKEANERHSNKETLEEVSERLYPIKNTGSMFMPSRNEVNNSYKQEGFIEGVKWQQERTFTTEEMEFIKRCIESHWELWNQTHEDNQKDWVISQNILNKQDNGTI